MSLITLPAPQKFYSSLFPSWEWRVATERSPDEKAALFSFAEKSGTLAFCPFACQYHYFSEAKESDANT
jgi:hypothetical protein